MRFIATKRKTTLLGGFVLIWLRRRDLNHATFGLWARRATKLLHSAIYGAGNRDRTGTGWLVPRDFKSRASANFAIPACGFRLPLGWLPVYHNTFFFICQYLFWNFFNFFWKNLFWIWLIQKWRFFFSYAKKSVMRAVILWWILTFRCFLWKNIVADEKSNEGKTEQRQLFFSEQNAEFLFEEIKSLHRLLSVAEKVNAVGQVFPFYWQPRVFGI